MLVVLGLIDVVMISNLLFSRIEGDYFAILGLPLMGLMDLLRRHGELKA